MAARAKLHCLEMLGLQLPLVLPGSTAAALAAVLALLPAGAAWRPLRVMDKVTPRPISAPTKGGAGGNQNSWAICEATGDLEETRHLIWHAWKLKRPYGQTPLLWKERHSSVLYFGWRLRVRSSSRP